MYLVQQHLLMLQQQLLRFYSSSDWYLSLVAEETEEIDKKG